MTRLRALLALLALLTSACGSTRPAKVSPAPAPPVVARPPAPVPVAAPCLPVGPPAPPPEPRAPELRRGDEAYERGDLAAAAAAYDAYLATAPAMGAGREVDRVLARLVVLSSLPPTRDPVAARDYHERLVREYPDSTHRAEADLVLRASAELDAQRKKILDLEKEVARLKQVVEKLKEIDLAPKKPP